MLACLERSIDERRVMQQVVARGRWQSDSEVLDEG